MISRKLSLVFGLCLLTGCVAEQQLTQDASHEQSINDKENTKKPELTEQQKAIDAKYAQAFTKWREKMQPISEHLVKACRPKNDKKYIKCLNEKNNEIIEASFLPDLTIKMLNSRQEFEQQLLRKKITRNEFMEQAEKLQKDMLNQTKAQVEKDIKLGIYSAKY